MTHLSWDESLPCVLENSVVLAGVGRDNAAAAVGGMENT